MFRQTLYCFHWCSLASVIRFTYGGIVVGKLNYMLLDKEIWPLISFVESHCMICHYSIAHVWIDQIIERNSLLEKLYLVYHLAFNTPDSILQNAFQRVRQVHDIDIILEITIV